MTSYFSQMAKQYNSFGIAGRSDLCQKRQSWTKIGLFFTMMGCPNLANGLASAQIIPDATLPSNSTVAPDGSTLRIEGGTRAGGNLFHSFQEFSVKTGTEAHFNSAPDISNILTRVTGGKISNIDGSVRANGTANLFLINPAGIIFSPNARLNIGGSFIGSTASSIKFADGSFFSATSPAAPPLLRVNVPVGLQFGQNPGKIVNQSRAAGASLPAGLLPLAQLPPEILPLFANAGLEVKPGQSLALIGGDIQLIGGNLSAMGGGIHLGSVASRGLVSLTPTPVGLSPNYENIENFGNIQLEAGSKINTSGLGSGRIEIRGENVALSNSRLVALTLGNIDGRGIDISANSLRLGEGSQISTLTLGSGAASAVSIRATDSVEMSGTGFVSYQQILSEYLTAGTGNPFNPNFTLITGTVGTGAAGDITIDAGRLLLLRDGVVAFAGTLGAVKGANMTLRAGTVELAGSGIDTGTVRGSAGAGGDITIEAGRLTVRDGAAVSAITLGDGPGGNIAIRASDTVEVFGTPAGSVAPTTIITGALQGTGKAGDITVDTGRLMLSDGAGMSSSNGGLVGQTRISATGGPGGNLTIRARESVDVSGFSSNVFDNGTQAQSFLTAFTLNSYPGGNISISAPRLTVSNGAYISVASAGSGKAGDITIGAQKVEVIGRANPAQFISKIEASVARISRFENPNSSGNAGALNINAGSLTVRDGGLITVSNLGTGSTGTLTVVADSVRLNSGGILEANTNSGAGGNLSIQASSLQMRSGSHIVTNANNADGGNISISAGTLVALENSDITANALSGKGGRVSVSATGIFGTQFRDATTPDSDITATSNLGPQFSGTVEINTPDVNPAAGLLEVSTSFTDISNQIVTGCAADRGNRFVVTGRGGIPADPSEPLRGTAVWRDVRLVGTAGTQPPPRNSAESPLPPPPPLVEATGWVMGAGGRVQLVANALTPQSPWYKPPNCGN
ncbi:MAG: S-layer family protein [Oscillatoria princeps RMCB-10]|jgi:filamentous hemagglutinin family protein|nr:S-layer family protein [Oscillatoria princeps RMCB-10]